MTASAAVSVPGVKVKVVDTVGAGDTFTAAMLAQLEKTGLLTKRSIAGLTRAPPCGR